MMNGESRPPALEINSGKKYEAVIDLFDLFFHFVIDFFPICFNFKRSYTSYKWHWADFVTSDFREDALVYLNPTILPD